MSQQPNILIIHCDQLRSDCLGCYGNREIKTPNIDSLSENGVTYINHHTVCPICTPSRYSFWSSMYIHQHGAWDNTSTFPSGYETFPKILRNNGYQTVAVGKMHMNPTYQDIGFSKMELAEQNGIGPVSYTHLDVYKRQIVYGNSGGKDSALVGILCRKACDHVLGVMMPCQSSRNFGEDMEDGRKVAEQFDIPTITVDLTEGKEFFCSQVGGKVALSDAAKANIAPRMRMITLYAIAQSKNYLVAGTGNRSEAYVGYFTKWGDGGHDFNPIADLTVKEVYEFLRFLNAPENIITKAPSAGLFEGQTDEKEMGITYEQIDRYLLEGEGEPEAISKIEAMHQKSQHKRQPPAHL